MSRGRSSSVYMNICAFTHILIYFFCLIPLRDVPQAVLNSDIPPSRHVQNIVTRNGSHRKAVVAKRRNAVGV